MAQRAFAQLQDVRPASLSAVPDGVLSLGYGGAVPWPMRQRRSVPPRECTHSETSVPYPSHARLPTSRTEISPARGASGEHAATSLTTLTTSVYGARKAWPLRVQRRRRERRRKDRLRLSPLHRPASLTTSRETIAGALADQQATSRAHRCGGLRSSADLTKFPKTLTCTNSRPWTMVARVLLTGETITKE